jgi:transcriptional regulator
MRSISECVEEAIEQARQNESILEIEATAQRIAAECGALDRIDEIAERLLREGAHGHIPVKMNHLAANR